MLGLHSLTRLPSLNCLPTSPAEPYHYVRFEDWDSDNLLLIVGERVGLCVIAVPASFQKVPKGPEGSRKVGCCAAGESVQPSPCAA